MAAASALAEFPEKDLQSVIQWGADRSTVTAIRSVTPHAEAALSEDIITTDKSGGAGAIATKFVSAQKAGGYTLLMGAENPQFYIYGCLFHCKRVVELN